MANKPNVIEEVELTREDRWKVAGLTVGGAIACGPCVTILFFFRIGHTPESTALRCTRRNCLDSFSRRSYRSDHRCCHQQNRGPNTQEDLAFGGPQDCFRGPYGP